MFLTFKKWSALYVLCFVALFVIFGALIRQGAAVQASAGAAGGTGTGVLIIDPGHGGEDGGAVADDGTIESGLNLSIALTLEDMARLLGWDTVMTRRTDISIHDASCETLREKKNSDLRNRAALCSSVGGGILVSIHQNSLPAEPSVQGAQVFYNGIEPSEAVAQAIQETLDRAVNSGRSKSIKEAGSSIYLMSHVTCPAVLVECGFLSNPQETALLRTQAHQTRLALAILAGLGQSRDSGQTPSADRPA